MILLLIILMFTFCLHSETIHVSGDVSGVWDADSIKVDSVIAIPEGEVLTILPGTVVEFQGSYNFQVHGWLNCAGVEGDSIVFTINDTTGFGNPDSDEGGWQGIDFDSWWPVTDTCVISYAIFEYVKELNLGWHSGALVFDEASRVKISDSRFSYNQSRRGGAINMHLSTFLSISDCIISHNNARFSGGGIYVEVDTFVFENNLMYCNNGASSGGGISFSGRQINLIDNTIKNNIATSTGGGLEIHGWSNNHAIIRGNTISGNSATTGGGVSIEGCDILLENNSISGNTAYTKGGMDLSSSTVRMYNNYIQDNSASGINCTSVILNAQNNVIAFNGGSGILVENFSEVLMSNNTISNNNGPGMWVRDSCNTVIMSNIICNNTTTSRGGGLRVENSTPVLVNNVICNNYADGLGGGLSFDSDYEVYPVLINNIIYGNQDHIQPCQLHFFTQNVSPNFYNNDILGGLAYFSGEFDSQYILDHYINNLNTDPCFINPTGGGGVEFNALEADWRLNDYSPLIDNGVVSGFILPDSSSVIDSLLGYSAIGDAYDIGAYEFDPSYISNDFLISKSNQVFLSNYPNPFNPVTNINFDLPQTGNVKLSIYNIRGQLIKTLVNEEMNAGSHSVVWNGKNSGNSDVSSGIYFYRIDAEGQDPVTRKMILMK